MPSADSALFGARAEAAAGRKWGLTSDHGPGYDLVSPNNGTRYQVKSADADRDTPRIRVWRSDHRALQRAHQACYVLVLYSSASNTIQRIEKVPLAAVANAANWGPSGHEKGVQAKININDLL